MKFKFLTKNKISQLPKGPGVYPHTKGRQDARSTNFNFNNLPSGVGVYIFSAHDGLASGRKNGGKLLYIGKATNIKNRVKNHFQQPARSRYAQSVAGGPTYRNNLFIKDVKKIGYIETNSEIEALLLEANLIKKHQPKFNVIWRDDKNYFYVAITKEDYPRIFITHQPKREARSIKYVGPFVDGKALKQTLKILRKIFPYRSCKNLPKLPCLWHQLTRCPAPCKIKNPEPNEGKDSPKGYISKIKNTNQKSEIVQIKKECQSNTKNLIKVLEGEKKWVAKNLEKEMKKAAKEENFETAAKIRNQLFSLEKILAHSKIFSLGLSCPEWAKVENNLRKILRTKNGISRIEAYDISNIQGQQATGAMITFIKGESDKNFYRKFKIKITGKPNDTAMIKEVLKRRFRHSEWPYPDLILIDGGKGQLNATKSIVKLNKLKIPVLALAKKNNELYIEGRKKPIFLKNLPREIFNLVLQLRDEAHRFAINYHKKLRAIDLGLKS